MLLGFAPRQTEIDAARSTRETDEEIARLQKDAAVRAEAIDRRTTTAASQQLAIARQVMMLLSPERTGRI